MKSIIYSLLDGAMMNGVDSHMPAALPHPAWLHPLTDPDDPGASFGPMLLEQQAAQEAGQQEVADALCRAVPASLHLSLLHSTLTPAAMAKHLRQFTKIRSEDRQAYFLRFTDCRVMLVLSRVLTAGQWRALTAPVTQWEIHQRDGTKIDLPLGDDTAEANAGPWVLSDAQLEACMEAEEPDILLNQLGYTLESMNGNIHGYWKTARKCVTLWQQGGTRNRQTLFNSARKIFQSEGPALQ